MGDRRDRHKFSRAQCNAQNQCLSPTDALEFLGDGL